MDILVLVATYEEFRPYLLIPGLSFAQHDSDCRTATLHSGYNTFSVVQTGIGKVKAASITAEYLVSRHWDIIINAGMCGSLTEAAPGTCFYGTAFIEHDFDLTPIGIAPYELIQLDTDCSWIEILRHYLLPSIIPSLIITGDQFLAEAPAALRDKGALVCDMESAAIARVLHRFNHIHRTDIQGLFLKMVSDSGSGDDYKKNQDILCTKLAELVFNLCNLVCFHQLSGPEPVDFNTPVQS